MASKVSDTILSAIGAAGALVSSIFLTPPNYVWGVTGLVALAISSGLILRNRWVESNPNQWLLVIRNGQLRRAGVGLKTFVGLQDTVVRFPSRVERVEFTANNVTKQMQGVIITGFAFWSVYRDDDGPFRCYKYMEGGDANSSVQAMCESVLRNLIANSTLDQVLKNRNHLRDNMKKDLKDQFKGWGVWLQTVEITQVTISSERLFKDLQAEFRQDTRLKAEQIELTTQQEMDKQKEQASMKTAEMKELNRTRRQVTQNKEQLKRATQQAQYDSQKNEMEIKRLQREKQFQLQRLRTELEQNQQKLANEQKIASQKQAFEIEHLKKILQVDKLHDDKTLQKYQIDAMERVYNRLGIKEIRINQFVGEGQSNLASMLPSMGFAANIANSSRQ